MRSLAITGVILLALSRTSATANDPIASRAKQILVSRCAPCHGATNPQSDFSVLNHAGLLEKALFDETSKAVVPGDLNRSELWQRISTNDDDLVMPPSGPLSADEKATIREWIESGASDFDAQGIDQNEPRPWISTRDVYQAVEADLNRFLPEDTRDIRYFSLQNLHNNPSIDNASLQTYRAALSKLLNSLHWESSILLPEPIDEHNTIFRINLAEIGWDRGRLWHKLLKLYPYGLSFDQSSDLHLASSASRVYAATGSKLPIVRADWFIATASVPPLYHTLLELPDGKGADRALEYRLRVNTERDYEKNRLMRSAFVKSNVSQHNRLVDRHPSAYGAYWKSYDFASSVGRQNLLEAPLGPDFPGNEFSRHAFVADGGEIIFNLPNGMQGYMLVNGDGDRIDRGPIEVVFDSKQPLGNKEVINGISCMSCHNRGMQPFRDSVGGRTALAGSAARKVARLFRPQEQINQTLESDSSRFLQSLRRCTDPFLSEDQDPVRREPVTAIAKQFSAELNLETIAAELEFRNASELESLLESRVFRSFGFGVISNAGVMKRDTWDGTSTATPYSKFQLLSEQLDRGTPEKVF